MPIQEAAKSPLKALKYVRVDLSKENLGGNGEVYLNISSLSKRLLLSKEEILFAKWNGQLEKLIKDRIDAISKYKQQYMTLFNEYEMKSTKTGLRASTLGKVLEVAGQSEIMF